MTYSIDAHELRAQAFSQAIKDFSAWIKQAVSALKSQLHGAGSSRNLGHTA